MVRKSVGRQMDDLYFMMRNLFACQFDDIHPITRKSVHRKHKLVTCQLGNLCPVACKSLSCQFENLCLMAHNSFACQL